MKTTAVRVAFSSLSLLLVFSGCSSAPKKSTPELAQLEGKKVALLEIQGEATSRSVVEVALINQLVRRGTFILISKPDLEKARQDPALDPTDWRAIANAVGADYALKARVLEFDTTEREGYSAVEEEDSQLAEERGSNEAKTKRLYKVKSLEGRVKVQLEFTDLHAMKGDPDTRVAIAEKEDRVVAEAKTRGIRLPPRLRFLEKLSNEAFERFFEVYR